MWYFLTRPLRTIPFSENGAMAKYKSYDYAQSVLIPVSLEGQLMPGTWNLRFILWWKPG